MNQVEGDHFEEDSRYRQCNREAWLSVGIFLFSFIVIGGVSILVGYGKPGSEIQLIAGFPAWFFYGVVLGGIVCAVAPIFVVRFYFQEMSIEAQDEESEGNA